MIISVGWDRRVTFHEDTSNANYIEVDPARHLSGHATTLLCVALGNHGLLATGSEDGEIIVWNMESSAIRYRIPIPADPTRKESATACEKLHFLQTKSSNNAIAAVYHDGYLRIWNSLSGACSLGNVTNPHPPTHPTPHRPP